MKAIVAMSRYQVIGNQNALPWHLPADLKHFRQITTGKTVLMGRKTFESIGKPLPNRNNVILTKNIDSIPPIYHSNVSVYNEIPNEMDTSEWFLIGGSTMYDHFLPQVTELYVTRIFYDFKGDSFFPLHAWSKWQLEDIQYGVKDDQNRYPHQFERWIKK